MLRFGHKYAPLANKFEIQSILLSMKADYHILVYKIISILLIILILSDELKKVFPINNPYSSLTWSAILGG